MSYFLVLLLMSGFLLLLYSQNGSQKGDKIKSQIYLQQYRKPINPHLNIWKHSQKGPQNGKKIQKAIDFEGLSASIKSQANTDDIKSENKPIYTFIILQHRKMNNNGEQ